MKVIASKPGLKIRYNNKEYKTPLKKRINNISERNKIELELRKEGIDYQIIYPKKQIVNFNGKELSLSCFKDKKDNRDYKINNILSQKNLNLPSKISYRDQMSPVKNQGKLGSCVGFAMAAMKEWQEQQEYLNEISEGSLYRRDKDHYNLSEQWIYYKSKEIDPWPNMEGTSIRCALKQISKLGIPPEEGWVYNDSEKGKPKPWSHMISKWRGGGSYFRINYNNLNSSIYKYGPIVIGIVCFREIFNVGTDGFIPYPKYPFEQFGGHAICLTGFDRDKNIYEFKNSWSSLWGHYGYGYLPGEYLKDFMLDAWVLLDTDVTKDMLKK
jgi:hypothetical protein